MMVETSYKETPESKLGLLSCEDTMRSLQPKRGPSPNHAGFLILDFNLQNSDK